MGAFYIFRPASFENAISAALDMALITWGKVIVVSQHVVGGDVVM